MTDEQKKSIAKLRSTVISYAKIGKTLGISGDTVKSYCRRNPITLMGNSPAADTTPFFCRECGSPLTQEEKQKPRMFCSRACREKWWHSHPEKLNKKAVYDFKCAGCGKLFSSYGNSHRKYCSHGCYINARFKGGGSHE